MVREQKPSSPHIHCFLYKYLVVAAGCSIGVALLSSLVLYKCSFQRTNHYIIFPTVNNQLLKPRTGVLTLF
jgi:hypothetical protein